MDTNFTSDRGRDTARLAALFGSKPPPGRVLPVERVVPAGAEMSAAMLHAAASAAPLPGPPSTDGDISSGGWTDEEEREQTIHDVLGNHSPDAPVPRAANEVAMANQSNIINSSRFSAPVPPGQPVPARRLRTPDSPELQATFDNIRLNSSRNISSSSPSRMDFSRVSPEDVAPRASSTPVPPVVEYVFSRFSAPCLPQQPLSPAQTDNSELFARAKAIVTNSATAARLLKPSMPKSPLQTVATYFPRTDSCVDISKLPRDVVALVDNFPGVFTVDCEEPTHLKVKLRSPPTPDKFAVRSVRQAVEADFGWMNPANCIVPLKAPQFICAATMYFVPPRGVLLASFWGNDRAERFRHVQSLIEPLVPILEPVVRVIPGMACIVREGGEYARAVVVDRADAGLLKLICMDNYVFMTAPSGDIFHLPDELSPDRIKSSLFLARIRGIRSVPSTAQKDITQMIDGMMKNLMCTAGVLYPDEGSDRLPVADIVLQDTEIWLSDEIQKNFSVERMTGEPTFDAAMTNSKVVEQYQAGYYEFDKTVTRLKEAPGMEELIRAGGQSEDKAKQPPVEIELGQETDGGAVYNNDGHIGPIEQEGLHAPVVNALVEEEQPIEPLVQENPQPVAVARNSGLAHHIRNYSAFVDFMLAGAGGNYATKMSVIHNAASQALFLKMNYACENNDDLETLDGFLAHLKQMV